MRTSYPQELVDIAREKGYKAANLEYLDQILLEFKKENDNGIAIEVPKHKSISHSDIVAHLDKYMPLWRKKWKEFTTIQGDEKDTLTPSSLEKLKEIQEMIKQAFDEDHKFPIAGINKGLKHMVRSTGDEDRVDVANPGGNESVPSEGYNISSSIGTVIASYFSEKSLSQRLKSGEDITIKPPLMPCLIQELVGEDEDEHLPPVSGIIYTDKENVRIQAAFGHGELVVNSKGNFDNYFVTNEDVVHQYIGDKKVRIIPKINAELKKMELEEIENTEFAHTQSLSEEQSIRLANFARFVQEKYGMRMDLEFVLNPNSNIINIVQARPIPIGKRKGLAPSALSNAFISSENPQHTSAAIITPDVMAAKVITSSDEVIICDGVDQALSSYLKNKDNKVKAIIVNKLSPDTSHEAGFFTSQAIPVIQVDDFVKATAWVQNLVDRVLVVDPQHAALYQIEKEKYQDCLIEEGIFRSALLEQVTPIKREFAQGPSRQVPITEASNIGQLIIEARTNPEATQKLFRFVLDEVGKKTTRSYDKEEIKDLIKKLMTVPMTKEESLLQKQNLANILCFAVNIQNDKKISSPIIEQLLIDGYELYKTIDKMEANPENPEIKLNYLNVHQKFSGLISSKSKPGILSTSLFREIEKYDQKEELRKEIIDKGYDLRKINERDFIECYKHKDYFINKADHDKWLSFCYESFRNKEDASRLKSLVENIIKLDLQDYWLNVNFIEAYKKSPTEALQNLEAEYLLNLHESNDILKATKIIDRMEHQITKWSDPKNFKKLFETTLQQGIQEVSELIKLDKNKLSSNLAIKQLYRMVDVIDLSIKQLQNSPFYENEEQQVKNFQMMLNEFFKVMKIQTGSAYLERVQDMEDFLKSKIDSVQRIELSPSPNFSVIKANFFQDNKYGFLRGFGFVDNKSLADLYTLIHQTLLDSIGRKSYEINKDLIKRFPKFFKEIHERVLDKRTDFLKGYNQYYLSEDPEKISFLYATPAYPYIYSYYKIPLGVHSGTLRLNYNIDKETIETDITLFGGGEFSRQDRWQKIDSYFELLVEFLTDAKLIHHKSDEHHVNFKIEISKDTKNLDDLFKILNMFSDTSNTDSQTIIRYFKDINNEFYKKIAELGMPASFILSYVDYAGNIDSKLIMHNFKILEDSSNKEVILESQKREVLLRLISMDDQGIVDYKKLEENRVNPEYSHLNITDLLDIKSVKLSSHAYSVLGIDFAEKGNITNALIAAKKAISGKEKVSSFVEESLETIIVKLSENNMTAEMAEIAEITSSNYVLHVIANHLIEKGNTDIANQIIQKIVANQFSEDAKDDFLYISEASEYLTANVLKLLETGNYDIAQNLMSKIAYASYLDRLATKLFNEGNFDLAFKTIDRPNVDEWKLSTISANMIAKGDFVNAFKIINRIESDSCLSLIAELFIDKGNLDNAFKLAYKLTHQYYISRFLVYLIQNGNNIEGDSLILLDKIKDKKALNDISLELVKKGYTSEAAMVAKRISDDEKISNITFEQSYEKESKPHKQEENNNIEQQKLSNKQDSNKDVCNTFAIYDAAMETELPIHSKKAPQITSLDDFINSRQNYGQPQLPKPTDFSAKSNIPKDAITAIAALGAGWLATKVAKKLAAGNKSSSKTKKSSNQLAR